MKTSDGGRNWRFQHVGSSHSIELRGIKAMDANNLWATGGNGSIMTTFNGGDDWYRVVSPCLTKLYSIAGAGDGCIWAIGENTIIKTVDGSLARE